MGERLNPDGSGMHESQIKWEQGKKWTPLFPSTHRTYVC